MLQGSLLFPSARRLLQALGAARNALDPWRIRSTIAAASRVTTVAFGTRHASQIVHRSPFEGVDVPQCNFAEHVMRNWKSFGSRTAILDATTGRQYTYTQLNDSVIKTASALRRLGFGQGDTLCICSPNVPEYPIVFFAVLSLGGTVTPANPIYTKGELLNVLHISKAKVAICIALNLHVMLAAIQDLPNPKQVKNIFVIGGKQESGSVPTLATLMNDDGSRFKGFARVDSRDDVASLPFSSGTTGLPKGVMLTHYNLTANAIQSVIPELSAIGPLDTIAGVLPFFHIYGLMVVMCLGLVSGARVVTFPKWDMQHFLHSTAAYKINHMALVPPLIVALTKDSSTSSFDLTCVRSVGCGAAPLSELQAAAFMDKFKHVNSLQQGFGMSETSPVASGNPLKNFKLGSSGPLLPSVIGRIVDINTGNDLEATLEGELLLKGPNIMKGYLENPEANAAIFTHDGWMRTGDIGYFDRDGHLYVVERLKELIKYKGLQVPPAELEAILLTHPSVQDAAVVGVTSPDGNELPRAHIVLKKGETASAASIEAYLADRVAPYKKLRGGVVFTEVIPKNAAGKTLRRLLKEAIL